MPGHVQLIVIRQANRAVVLRPRIYFRSIVVPRGIPDPLLELLRLPSVLAIRSRRVLDRLALGESLVFLILENFPVMMARLRSPPSFLVDECPLTGNHVAGYYPSSAVNLPEGKSLLLSFNFLNGAENWTADTIPSSVLDIMLDARNKEMTVSSSIKSTRSKCD